MTVTAAAALGCSPSPAGGEEKPLLNGHGVIALCDSRKIAGRCVTRGAPALTGKERGAGRRITGHHAFGFEEIDALGQHFVQPLMQEMPDFLDLRVGQAVALPSALQIVALLEVRAQLAGIAIAQKNQRAHQVRPAVRAAGLRAVTRDALGGPHRPAAFRGGTIDDVLVAGTGAGEHALRSLRAAALSGASRNDSTQGKNDRNDRIDPVDPANLRCGHTSQSAPPL